MQARPENVGSEEDAAKDYEAHSSLRTSRMVLSHSRKREARINEGGLELLSAELVIAETTEGNRVAKVLLKGDRVQENDEGGDDQKNVLEDTRHGKDNGGSLANLRDHTG